MFRIKLDLIKQNVIALFTIVLVTVVLCTTVFAKDRPLSPVKVDKVTEMALPATAVLMGTLYSSTHITITAGVDGRLQWLAEPGTVVRQGDTLAEMDLISLQLQYAEQLAKIKRTKINVRYLKNEVERLKKLRSSHSASQFQLDQTLTQYDLGLADIEIGDLKLKQLDDQIQRATAKAPFDGVVTDRFVRSGMDVNRSDALIKLLDTENLEVRLYVPIKYLAHLYKGKELTLSTDDQTMTAAVTSVIPSADQRSQTFEIRILIPSKDNQSWSAGQLVKVTVPVQSELATLTVQRDALILRKDGTFVVKIDAENRASFVLVNVGKGTFDRVTVMGDLHQGDRVAIRGAERLQEGQSVIIQ